MWLACTVHLEGLSEHAVALSDHKYCLIIDGREYGLET